MIKKIKLVVKYLVGAALLGALIFAFIPEAEQVDMTLVSRGDVVIALEAEGRTRIHDIYVVSAPIEGRVMRIESEPGDQVKAGVTVIAHMTPADPRFLDKRSEIQAEADVQGAVAAKGLAQSKLDRALAELEYAKAEYRRTDELFKNGNVSIARLEQAELQLKMRRAEVETARADLKVMESRLRAARAQLVQPGTAAEQNGPGCQLCVHAPVDGKVLKLLHKSEGVIPMGTPLVEVGDPSALEVVIEMLSRDAVKVRPGDMALIQRWGGGEDIRAQVRLVEPSGFTKISALGVEEQRVNVILDFIDPIEKWQSLGHAFRVEGSIIVDKAENVLNVPVSALFRYNEQWSTFVVRDGRAVRQPVTVGRRNERSAEIVAGLEEGSQVIIHPGNNVVDGTRVTARE
ncbi:efflux RND transporter periplasmic adaptor subunit [Paremcibacter congregatus]|uniref:efflux RND transporter periplasmic adaptor subunit n=1 Tax=Paremcibacter congregatus TaxID=2043170 RepID=UPI0030EF56A2|tara:strand:+ start:1694 stop:2899 length:1206 start_codon:yes stop_codon:yes gene_type:complete